MRRLRTRDAVIDGRRVVRTLDELEVELERLHRRAVESDSALRAGFAEFRVELDLEYPDDPFCDDYRKRVLSDFSRMSGRQYDVANESTVVPVDAVFPYSTGDPATAGDHLMRIGHLLRSIPVPTGSRVLELGFGWGHTVLALAQLGYAVHGVDIEPGFVDLVRSRSETLGLTVDLHVGDFSRLDTTALGLDHGTFDAVIFFESFHHANDHVGLLRQLDRLVADDGAIVFAAEPILDDFPVPWGLRLDGESAWAIRQHGWLELGFRTSYFESLMAREGWVLTHHPAEVSNGDVYVATRT